MVVVIVVAQDRAVVPRGRAAVPQDRACRLYVRNHVRYSHLLHLTR